MRDDDSMGKKSRRPSRRNRHALESNSFGLTVTVGASPRVKSSGQPALDNELRLLRSSLLYADHVNLIAPSAAWMRTFSPLLDTDPEDPLRTIADLPAVTLERLGVEAVTPQQFSAAMRALGARPNDDPLRQQAEALWRPAIMSFRQQAVEVFDSHEALELDMALDAGFVTLISDGSRLEDSTAEQVKWFRDRLTQALADSSSSVLLDEVTTEFLREAGGYADGLPAVVDDRSRRTAVGAGLVERLPTFPDAPMSHILEAREELGEDRAAYRKAVKELASKLQSSALEETLSSEIDELWHDAVRPKLEDLRKSATATRVGAETAKRLFTEGYGLPTLLVAVANFTDLAAALPTPAAALAAATRVAAAGAQEAFRTRATVRRHDLVYLLDVNTKLSKKTRR